MSEVLFIALALSGPISSLASLSFFSGRNLRIGGASDLLAIGVPAMMIQLLGRWAGDTYRIYSRVCGRNLLDISRRMAVAEGETLEASFRDYVQSARV